MSLFKKLFGGASDKKQNGGASDQEQQIVSGSQIGQQVERLAEKSAAEGWDPIGSIHVRCSACSATIDLTRGPSFQRAKLCFKTSRGKLKDLSDPLSCEKCKADSFEIQFSRKSFKDVLREAVDARPPCA